MFAMWEWSINSLSLCRFACVTCLDRRRFHDSVRQENNKKRLLRLREPRLQKIKQNVEVQTPYWIGSKCCKHWQVIFSDTDVFPGSEAFALPWHKTSHSSVKEQNIQQSMEMLSNENSSFQKCKPFFFQNLWISVCRCPGLAAKPAGTLFYPEYLAVLFASVRAELTTEWN